MTKDHAPIPVQYIQRASPIAKVIISEEWRSQ